MDTQTGGPVERTPSTALVPPVIRTCEGNELLPNTDIPPPLYSAPPIGSATTVTVQTYSISDAVMGIAETVIFKYDYQKIEK